MLLAGVVLKFVPVIVTVVPIAPEAGVKEVIVGGITEPITKSIALTTVMQFVVTDTLPVVVPVGTVVVRVVAVLAVTVAVLSLKNLTTLLAGMALKLVPVIVTLVPMGPTDGVKPVMVGAGTLL